LEHEGRGDVAKRRHANPAECENSCVAVFPYRVLRLSRQPIVFLIDVFVATDMPIHFV